MSVNANPNILNMLLPNKLPIAISGALIFNAAMDVTSSGKEVIIATNVEPIKLVPKPVMSEIVALLLTINGVAIINSADARMNPKIPAFKEGMDFNSSSVKSAVISLLSFLLIK